MTSGSGGAEGELGWPDKHGKKHPSCLEPQPSDGRIPAVTAAEAAKLLAASTATAFDEPPCAYSVALADPASALTSGVDRMLESTPCRPHFSDAKNDGAPLLLTRGPFAACVAQAGFRPDAERLLRTAPNDAEWGGAEARSAATSRASSEQASPRSCSQQSMLEFMQQQAAALPLSGVLRPRRSLKDAVLDAPAAHAADSGGAPRRAAGTDEPTGGPPAALARRPANGALRASRLAAAAAAAASEAASAQPADPGDSRSSDARSAKTASWRRGTSSTSASRTALDAALGSTHESNASGDVTRGIRWKEDLEKVLTEGGCHGDEATSCHSRARAHVDFDDVFSALDLPFDRSDASSHSTDLAADDPAENALFHSSLRGADSSNVSCTLSLRRAHSARNSQSSFASLHSRGSASRASSCHSLRHSISNGELLEASPVPSMSGGGGGLADWAGPSRSGHATHCSGYSSSSGIQSCDDFSDLLRSRRGGACAATASLA